VDTQHPSCESEVTDLGTRRAQTSKEDVKSEALDILADCLTRFGPQLAPLHEKLKDALLPQVRINLRSPVSDPKRWVGLSQTTVCGQLFYLPTPTSTAQHLFSVGPRVRGHGDREHVHRRASVFSPGSCGCGWVTPAGGGPRGAAQAHHHVPGGAGRVHAGWAADGPVRARHHHAAEHHQAGGQAHLCAAHRRHQVCNSCVCVLRVSVRKRLFPKFKPV